MIVGEFWEQLFDTVVKITLGYIFDLPGSVTMGELRHMKLKGVKVINDLDELVLMDDGTDYCSSVDDDEDYFDRTSNS